MQIPSQFVKATFERLVASYPGKVGQVLAESLYDHLKVTPEQATLQIEALEHQGLIQFALSKKGEPAVFIAQPKSYQTEADRVFADQLVAYFDVHGQFNASNGAIVKGSEEAVSEVSAKRANSWLRTVEGAASLVQMVHTPEGDLSVIARVVQKLVDLHLIAVDDQGHYHGPSKAEVMQWVEEHGICDFCSDPNPKHTEIVPDFVLVPGTEQNSVGGWATCDTCHQFVSENRRTDLLRRGIDASLGGKFTAAALKGLHQRFWQAKDDLIDAAAAGAAMLDFIENRVSPEKPFVNPKLQQKEARTEAIRRMTGLTQDEMDALGKGDVLYKEVAKKLASWRKRFGTGDAADQKRLAEMLNAVERPPIPPYKLPHWQLALDQKVSALTKLTTVLRQAELVPDAEAPPGFSRKALLADMSDDLVALQVADVYSFNADTMHAIQAAAASIPHEAPLKSVEVPMARAGWFWFAEPLPVVSASMSADVTHALLWSWDREAVKPTIRFSAYVIDEKGSSSTPGVIFPSTYWMWPLDATFHDMIAQTTVRYRSAYGPTGYYKDVDKAILSGEEATLKAVSDMSLFFMQACQWFRETVPGTKKKMDPKLTQTPGHIERHARKRYEKQFKTQPTVRVIALRKSTVTTQEHVETTDAEGKRHLTVRHVVSGHHRLQPCGPGRKDTKLIWIDSYVKGPDDAPFKGPSDKVFAVIR